MGMTPKEEATNDLIGALLTWARQGAHILDHMSRHSGGELGSDESLDILAELMRPILKPIVARQSPSDVRKVSAVLLDAYHLVADELLFVDPSK